MHQKVGAVARGHAPLFRQKNHHASIDVRQQPVLVWQLALSVEVVQQRYCVLAVFPTKACANPFPRVLLAASAPEANSY